MATRNYVDELGVPEFVVTTGMLPTLTLVDIVRYTLQTNKTVINNKIWVVGKWVERGRGEWFNTSSSGFY